MIVLNTFCVDDTPVSIQPPLTTKDTKHMKDNAWPGRNGKKKTDRHWNQNKPQVWFVRYNNSKKESNKQRITRIVHIRMVIKGKLQIFRLHLIVKKLR